MKTYAHHDAKGAIKSIVHLNAGDGAGLMLTPNLGEFVSEIEAKFKSKTPTIEELQEIAANFKIAGPIPHAQLSKKD